MVAALPAPLRQSPSNDLGNLLSCFGVLDLRHPCGLRIFPEIDIGDCEPGGVGNAEALFVASYFKGETELHGAGRVDGFGAKG